MQDLAPHIILLTAARSVLLFPITLVGLYRGENMHRTYGIPGHGRYTVFRDTIQLREAWRDVTPMILVIGFRLRWIKSNRFFHWLFQRVCIITTPFWSGLIGFKEKLWMVDRITKEYLGIYQWLGERPARYYIAFLIPILRIFSLSRSIWYTVVPATPLNRYLLQNTN